MKCPKCGSEQIYQTLMGFIYWRIPGKNENDAHCCDCGWKGKAWEAGAELIPPVRGTENMTDEEWEHFKNNFKMENIRIADEPGIGYINLDAIRRLELYKEDKNR